MSRCRLLRRADPDLPRHPVDRPLPRHPGNRYRHRPRADRRLFHRPSRHRLPDQRGGRSRCRHRGGHRRLPLATRLRLALRREHRPRPHQRADRSPTHRVRDRTRPHPAVRLPQPRRPVCHRTRARHCRHSHRRECRRRLRRTAHPRPRRRPTYRSRLRLPASLRLLESPRLADRRRSVRRCPPRPRGCRPPHRLGDSRLRRHHRDSRHRR